MRFALVFVLIGVGACDSAPPNQAEMLKQLKSQATLLANAMVRNDHQKLIDLTHPEVIKKLGGADGARVQLEKIAKEMDSRWPSRTIDVGEPTAVEPSNGDWYGIVPFSLRMKGPELRASISSFVIGVSSDGGRNWKFIDGNQADTLSKARTFLPNFPEKLALPKLTPANIEKTK